jgi:serine/threonine protein kinase
MRFIALNARAKAVAALSHPNILAIYDFGTEQGVSDAVMELLEGETIARLFPTAWGLGCDARLRLGMA